MAHSERVQLGGKLSGQFIFEAASFEAAFLFLEGVS